MQKSFVFAVALVAATAWAGAVSRAGDPTLDQLNGQPLPCNGSHCGDQLNPQPLPPGDKINPAVSTGGHIPQTELNPQPLPPGMKSPYQNELNPQPLPPGRAAQ